MCPECNSLILHGTRLCSNGITLSIYVFHVMACVELYCEWVHIVNSLYFYTGLQFHYRKEELTLKTLKNCFFYLSLSLTILLCNRALLSMPAFCKHDDTLACKLVTAYPENADKGLPSVQGTVLLFDSTTGKVCAVRTPVAKNCVPKSLDKVGPSKFLLYNLII